VREKTKSRDFIAPFPIRYIPTRTSIRLLESTLIYHILFSIFSIFYIHICKRETIEILRIKKILGIEIVIFIFKFSQKSYFKLTLLVFNCIRVYYCIMFYLTLYGSV